MIGRDAGRDLKRLASSVYWAGLNSLGIRTMMGSQATFLSYGPEMFKDHDLKLWSSSLPKAPANLFEEATFALTPKEADFLRDPIASNAKPSLLNELSATGKSFSQDWPWQSESTISKSNRALLRHAERFSGVMYGASLLYNLLLARRAAERPNAKKHADAPALIAHYRSRLDDWTTKLNFFDLNSWDLDGRACRASGDLISTIPASRELPRRRDSVLLTLRLFKRQTA